MLIYVTPLILKPDLNTTWNLRDYQSLIFLVYEICQLFIVMKYERVNIVKMRRTCIAFALSFLLVGVTATEKKNKACKVTMWQPTLAVQRLSISPIVVIGTIYGYMAHNDSAVDSFHALFNVTCVLKSDDIEVKSQVVIENIYPRTGCSGTKEDILKDERSVVGLRRLENGNFEWHEKNPLESMSINASYDFVSELSQTCGLQNWTVPRGSNDVECPICSVDFGIVGAQDECMMSNLRNETCAEIPEFKIFSHCSCDHASTAGIVFSGVSILKSDLLFVLVMFLLNAMYVSM